MKNFNSKRSNVPITFGFFAALAGVGLALVFTIGNTKAQLAVLGGYLSVLIALLSEMSVRFARFSAREDVSAHLSQQPMMRQFYEDTVGPLGLGFRHQDPVFRELLKQRLREFVNEVNTEWSNETISWRGELWRTPYLQIIEAPDVHSYKSIAWVKSEDYWHDRPGRQALESNFELAKTKSITRIFLIRESVWDSSVIKQMIRDHQKNRIKIIVVKESEVPEGLRHDLGIYGNRACGYQILDDRCRTERYDLHFGAHEIAIAERRFSELQPFRLLPDELESYLGHC